MTSTYSFVLRDDPRSPTRRLGCDVMPRNCESCEVSCLLPGPALGMACPKPRLTAFIALIINLRHGHKRIVKDNDARDQNSKNNSSESLQTNRPLGEMTVNLLSLPDDLLRHILDDLYEWGDPEELFTIKYQCRRLYALCLPFIFRHVQISFFRGGSDWTKYDLLMRSLGENPGLLGHLRCVDLRFTWPRSNEGTCELVKMIMEGEDGEGGGGEKWIRKEINDRGWCLTGPGQGDRCVYYREGVDWKWYLGWS